MAPPRKGSGKFNKRPQGGKSSRKPEGKFRPLAGGVAPKHAQKTSGVAAKHADKTGVAASKRADKPEVFEKEKVEKPQPVRRALMQGPAPRTNAPLMLTMPSFDDYELIDSGFEQKLERYGPYTVVRPEGQALWQPRLSEATWKAADAVFSGNDDEETAGRWRFQNRLAEAKKEHDWTLGHEGLKFQARFTAFRHMGFFPEQAAHWHWFHDLIKNAGRPIKVLNLFGYTGLASLMAAKAGASVTHVDASKKAIGWARENQSISSLDDAPIRWICDDAVKFVEREARRGNTYDGIIMDPPKYGRGPKGEVWQFFEGANDLLHASRAILSEDPLFFILSSYAIRASFMASHELARDAFSGLGGVIESGELLINETDSERQLSTSLYTRWSKEGTK